jgi:hypothetical protein
MTVLQYVAEMTATPATGTGPYANVFHIFTTTATTARANAHIGALKSFYQTLSTGLYPTTTSTLIGRQVVAVDVDPPVYVPSTSQTVNGINGTGYLPPQIAVVVSWRTLTATRHGRGRTYLGPLAAAMDGGDGKFSSVNLANAQTASTALIAAIKAIDPNDALVVFHRRTGPTPKHPGTPVTSPSWIVIESATVANVPHVQRRRGS